MLKDYIRIGASGYIFGHQQNDELPIEHFQEEFGETWVEVPSVDDLNLFDDYLYRYDSDMGSIALTDTPRLPVAPATLWDDEAGEWVDPRELQEKKDDKWSEIKAARDAEEFSTFTWNSYTFQCDEVSQQRLQGAVLRAQIDPEQSVDWTLADNTAQTFTATEIKQVGLALAAHVDSCHIKARQLRAQIDAAASETELNTINW